MPIPIPQSRKPDIAGAVRRVTSVSFFLVVFSIVMLAASLLSLPFPFVRSVWMTEVWGVSGAVNAAILMLIAQRIERMSIGAALAGLGMIVTEQAVTWRDFFYLFSQDMASRKVYLYFGLSASVSFVLLIFVVLAIQGVFYFRRIHPHFPDKGAVDEEGNRFYHEPSSGWLLPLVESAVTYAALAAGIYFSSYFRPRWQFSFLKMIAEFASLAAMVGVGCEITEYLKKNQSRYLCVTKSATHVLIFAAFLWAACRLMPVGPAIGEAMEELRFGVTNWPISPF